MKMKVKVNENENKNENEHFGHNAWASPTCPTIVQEWVSINPLPQDLQQEDDNTSSCAISHDAQTCSSPSQSIGSNTNHSTWKCGICHKLGHNHKNCPINAMTNDTQPSTIAALPITQAKFILGLFDWRWTIILFLLLVILCDCNCPLTQIFLPYFVHAFSISFVMDDKIINTIYIIFCECIVLHVSNVQWTISSCLQWDNCLYISHIPKYIKQSNTAWIKTTTKIVHVHCLLSVIHRKNSNIFKFKLLYSTQIQNMWLWSQYILHAISMDPSLTLCLQLMSHWYSQSFHLMEAQAVCPLWQPNAQSTISHMGPTTYMAYFFPIIGLLVNPLLSSQVYWFTTFGAQTLAIIFCSTTISATSIGANQIALALARVLLGTFALF